MMKKMLVTFFDIKNVFHFEFIPQGQTVQQDYYVEIWKWLLEAVPKKGILWQAVSGPKIDYWNVTPTLFP
jgi:hypothetical protein